MSGSLGRQYLPFGRSLTIVDADDRIPTIERVIVKRWLRLKIVATLGEVDDLAACGRRILCVAHGRG